MRLEVKDLRIQLALDRAEVVGDVSFSVRAAELLGLVGESGSGKTTVALALLGHARRGLDIAAGEIRLDGENLLELKAGELRELRGAKVAYVPQDPSAALDPTLRIGFQLREALRVHPGAVDDVEAAHKRGPARVEARLHARDAEAVPPSALRRSTAAGGTRHGVRLPAVTHRSRRADDRPRRVHPAARA